MALSLAAVSDSHAVGGLNGIRDAAIGTADATFQMHAVAAQSEGWRTYTLRYVATDARGNEAGADARVVVLPRVRRPLVAVE